MKLIEFYCGGAEVQKIFVSSRISPLFEDKVCFNSVEVCTSVQHTVGLGLSVGVDSNRYVKPVNGFWTKSDVGRLSIYGDLSVG